MADTADDKKNLSTVWITNRLFTAGIEEIRAEPHPRGDPGVIIAEKVNWTGYRPHFYKEGKDWHRTKESAVARAEAMRDRKIAGLERQLAKLKGMKF